MCSRSAASRSPARASSSAATNPSAGRIWGISAPSSNTYRLVARDHAAPGTTLALAKAISLVRGRVRPLAWCSRPRSSAALLEGALMLLAFDWSELAQQTVIGLSSGGLWALLALAIVLIYRSTGVVNFAQGEMAMFSTFIAWSLVHHGLSFWAAFFLTIAISFAGGIAAARAAAVNPEASRLVGVRVSWMLALGWGLAAAMGAISGMLTAPALASFDQNLMQPVLLYAFAGAVLGGIESPLGAVIGSLLLGVFVNLIGTYVDWIGNELRLPVALAVILGVLLVRPAGLFGRAAARRV